MIKNVLLSKRHLGTNHLSFGYESSQLWVRIVWVRNVRGYKTSGFLTRHRKLFILDSKQSLYFLIHRAARTRHITDVNLFLECQNTFGVQINNREIQILRLLIFFPRQTSLIIVKCYISSLLTVKDATLRLLYVELYDY